MGEYVFYLCLIVFGSGVDDFEFVEVLGKGIVYVCMIVCCLVKYGGDFMVCVVDFDEGVCMLSWIIDVVFGMVCIGVCVEVVFELVDYGIYVNSG